MLKTNKNVCMLSYPELPLMNRNLCVECACTCLFHGALRTAIRDEQETSLWRKENTRSGGTGGRDAGETAVGGG